MTGVASDHQLIAVCNRSAETTLKRGPTNMRATMTERLTVLIRKDMIGRWACAVPDMKKSGMCQAPRITPMITLAGR